MTDQRAPTRADNSINAALDGLWPGVDVGPEATRPRHVALPSARNPRLIAPTSPRRAGAAAVRHYARLGRLPTRTAGTFVATALCCGLAPLLVRRGGRLRLENPGEAALTNHLAALLDRDVVIAVHLGPPRINQKPVLYLLSPRGELVAVAKAGTTDYARDLVHTEHAALQRLRNFPVPGVTTPVPLALTTWRGVPLLVQSALPLRGTRPPGVAAVRRAVHPLAEHAGVSRGALGGSPWWRDRRTRAMDTRGAATHDHLVRVLDAIEDRHDLSMVTFGAWHGDLTVWNAAIDAPGTLLLWDWERYDAQVPRGFDTLHLGMQRHFQQRRGTTQAVLDALAEPTELPGLAALPPGEARLTAALYAVEIAIRYGGRGRETPPRLTALGDALLSAADRLIGLRSGRQ